MYFMHSYSVQLDSGLRLLHDSPGTEGSVPRMPSIGADNRVGYFWKLDSLIYHLPHTIPDTRSTLVPSVIRTQQ